VRDRTLAEIAQRRAVEEPERVAFTFLQDGEQNEDRRTYRELHAALHR
jgi:acyl-CoA synthetase (AMP-forming)/AMP-acid ligase II